MEVAVAEPIGVAEPATLDQPAASNEPVAFAEPISSSKADRKTYLRLYGACAVAIILLIVGLSVGLTKRLTPTEKNIKKACKFFNYENDIELCLRNKGYGARNPEIGFTTIPSEIGLLTHMTSLQLYGPLIGTIPSTLGNLQRLRRLYISETQLNGTLPSSLGNLNEIETLWVEENPYLTGPIPYTFGQLTELKELILEGPQGFTGTIPYDLGGMRLLTSLTLSSNQLTGTIPPNFRDFKYLSRVVLGNTNLTGTIPAEWCDISGIAIYIDCDKVECTCCASMADRFQTEYNATCSY